MRVLLLLNSDLHSKAAYDKLSLYLSKYDTKVFVSQKVGSSKNLPKQIIDMQSAESFKFPEFYTLPDNINSDLALDEIGVFAPDIILSIRFGQIIKRTDLINLPRFGILNLHSGILPRYRGVMPSFWSILNGEKRLGATLHFITDPTIDTGNIVGFSESEIDWDDSLISNINRIYDEGCELVISALDRVFSLGRIDSIPQNQIGSTRYYSYPKETDVQSFLKLMRLY